MIKILVVAPYQEFADMFAEVFASHDEETLRPDGAPEEYELELLVEYNQDKMRAMNPVCDVLIARGFSATILKRGQDFYPVVEIPVLPYDIIRCLNKARERFGRRKIVFPATANMTNHAEYLSGLLDLDLEIIPMPSTMGREPEIAFSKIRDRDCVIIGGMPLCAMAEKMGFDHVMIESGPEAMHSALSEAKRLASIRRAEQEKAQSFKAILDYNADGIVAFDKQNRFLSVNSMAEKILGLDAKKALGKRMADFFPGERLADFLDGTPQCSDEVVRFRGAPLAVNKTGIFLAGERIGSVATLQYVAKIQNSEKNIRNKIMERGLVARHGFRDILGVSPGIRQAVQTARKYSRVDSSVLIVGRSGTGKELFAQSIHNESAKRKYPFVAINCAAISESLLESELFGYVEGAFTGASKGGKPGLIELAHQGTLFLDEISEMPMRLQGRLLRVLQEREIMRLGGDKVTHVDIRVVAATNRDLFRLAEANAFREDLYYRLAVLTLNLPALDERREDIPELAAAFLGMYAARQKRPPFTVTPEAMALLSSLPWRGNIRELRNACEQLAVLSEDDVIGAEAVERILAEKIRRRLQGETDPETPAPPEVTREKVASLLAEGHSRRRIAESFGIDRTTLWRKMRGWGMLQPS